MRPAQEDLLMLVDRIFSDGIVTPAERSELLALYRDNGLTVAEVREVFTTFITQCWGDSIADDVLTDGERRKLAIIVRELHVPRDCVPNAVAWAIAA